MYINTSNSSPPPRPPRSCYPPQNPVQPSYVTQAQGRRGGKRKHHSLSSHPSIHGGVEGRSPLPKGVLTLRRLQRAVWVGAMEQGKLPPL